MILVLFSGCLICTFDVEKKTTCLTLFIPSLNLHLYGWQSAKSMLHFPTQTHLEKELRGNYFEAGVLDAPPTDTHKKQSQSYCEGNTPHLYLSRMCAMLWISHFSGLLLSVQNHSIVLVQMFLSHLCEDTVQCSLLAHNIKANI